MLFTGMIRWKWIVSRRLPFFPDQPQAFGIARQSIEIRAEVRRKSLQALQPARRLEGLRVQFDARVRGEHAGTAAGVFLGVLRMRRAVGAEEEARIPAGRG